MLAIVWRRPYVFLLVATTALTTNFVTSLLKYAVQRDRPPTVVLDPEPLVGVPSTSSFPSGHTSTSLRMRVRDLAPGAAPDGLRLRALAALIGFSRVYVGVHYPLDVLAGAVLGLIVAKALLMLLEALRRSQRAPKAG